MGCTSTDGLKNYDIIVRSVTDEGKNSWKLKSGCLVFNERVTQVGSIRVRPIHKSSYNLEIWEGRRASERKFMSKCTELYMIWTLFSMQNSYTFVRKLRSWWSHECSILNLSVRWHILPYCLPYANLYIVCNNSMKCFTVYTLTVLNCLWNCFQLLNMMCLVCQLQWVKYPPIYAAVST